MCIKNNNLLVQILAYKLSLNWLVKNCVGTSCGFKILTADQTDHVSATLEFFSFNLEVSLTNEKTGWRRDTATHPREELPFWKLTVPAVDEDVEHQEHCCRKYRWYSCGEQWYFKLELIICLFHNSRVVSSWHHQKNVWKHWQQL